jgi:hydrogenase maturation protein HypF
MTASTGCSWNAETEAGRRRRRVRWEVRGRVQGVGFRPFVHRLAVRLGLSGWVANSAAGAILELEGEDRKLALFRQALVQELPYPGQVEQIQETDSADLGEPSSAGRPLFAIRPSQETGPAKPCLPADLAPCPECVRELFDPRDRRYRYPFLSCPSCGPRFSIVQALPFDRARTSLAAFPLCAECRAEYDDPGDRRFHGQTIACPRCGPRLVLRTTQGAVVASGEEALGQAEETLRQGGIVALKGLGGFQLLVDARDDDAVRRLRQRKNRPAKPLALLVPDLPAAHRLCHLDAAEQQILASPQAPIVLLHRRAEADVAPSVAPDLPWLGLMLPATPLHHLVARDLGFPLVATSGNRSEEPLCICDEEALDRLASIADIILTHDRDIVRPLDDSVVQVVLGRVMVLRRARGYVPEPVPLDRCRQGVWALGGHLKSTFAFALDGAAMLSQHLGDLDTPLARRGLTRALDDYRNLFQPPTSLVVRDLHPDYASTLAAHELADKAYLPQAAVQHHEAHV